MSESEMQQSLFAEIDLRGNQDPRWGRIFHVPNGGKRSKATAGRLKAEGVKAGVPDLILPVACRGYRGMVMELKVGRNQVSAEQADWLSWFKANGWHMIVIYDDPTAAVAEFEWYLNGAANV